MMPGGDQAAYQHLKDIVEKVGGWVMAERGVQEGGVVDAAAPACASAAACLGPAPWRRAPSNNRLVLLPPPPLLLQRAGYRWRRRPPTAPASPTSAPAAPATT